MMMLTCPRCRTEIALGGVHDDDRVEIALEGVEGSSGMRIAIKIPDSTVQQLRDGQPLHQCGGEDSSLVNA